MNGMMTTDPLEIFVCPISQEVMSDPVVASDGHTYERRCIEDWINLKGLDATSPKTNERLVHHHLTPNHTLKSGIADYHEAQRLAEKASQQRCQQPADTTNASIPPTPPLVGAASAVLEQPPMVPSAVSKGHVARSKIRATTSISKTAPSPKTTAVLTALATTPASAVKASSSEVQKAVGHLAAPVPPSAPIPPVAAVAVPAVVDHMPPLRQTRSRNESQVASYLDVVQNAAAGAEVPNMGQEQTQKVSRTKTLPKCDGDVRNHGRQVPTVSNIPSADVQQTVSSRGVVLSAATDPVPIADDSRQLDAKIPTSFVSKTKAEEIPRRPLQGNELLNDPESGRVGDLVKAFRRLKQEQVLGLQQPVTPIAASSGGHATVESEAVQTPSVAQETREAAAIAVDATAKVKAEQETRTKVEREAKELADKNAAATVAQVKAEQETGEISQAKARVDVVAMMMNANAPQAAAVAKAASDSKPAAATAKATTDKRRMAAAAAAAVEVAAAELAARPAGERAQISQRKSKQRKAPKSSANDDDEDHRLLEAAQQAVRLTAQPPRPANFKTLFVAIGLVLLLLSAWWCLENPPEDNDIMSGEHQTSKKLKRRNIEKLVVGTQKTKAEQALRPEIIIAASIGDIDKVRSLLELGADIDEFYNGVTPLLTAAVKGHLPLVQYLLEQGADKNKADNKGGSPLFLAVYNGHLGVVKYLVQQGMEMDKADQKGVSPIHTAAGGGHLDVLQYLLEQGVDKDTASYDNSTPLLIAAQEGHLAAVQNLLKYGADMDKTNNDGLSPLISAAMNGHLPVVQYLLEQGADKDKARNDGVNLLSAATIGGRLSVVKYLVEQGMKITNTDNEGRTVLMHAVSWDHLDVLRYLVDQGADKDKADNEGWTALLYAAQDGHFGELQYLVQQGADMDKSNNDGLTPLHIAAASGKLDAIKYLVGHGADMDKTDNYGRTPATIARVSNYVESFIYLDTAMRTKRKKSKKVKKPTGAKP